MKRLTLALCLALASCAHAPEARVVTKDVVVPVAVSCVPKIPAAPVFPDTDEAIAAAPDIFAAAKLYVAGRLMRIAERRELLAALKACAGP